MFPLTFICTDILRHSPCCMQSLQEAALLWAGEFHLFAMFPSSVFSVFDCICMSLRLLLAFPLWLPDLPVSVFCLSSFTFLCPFYCLCLSLPIFGPSLACLLPVLLWSVFLSLCLSSLPFTPLSFSQDYVQQYSGARLGSLPPHIFATVSEAVSEWVSEWVSGWIVSEWVRSERVGWAWNRCRLTSLLRWVKQWVSEWVDE